MKYKFQHTSNQVITKVIWGNIETPYSGLIRLQCPANTSVLHLSLWHLHSSIHHGHHWHCLRPTVVPQNLVTLSQVAWEVHKCLQSLEVPFPTCLTIISLISCHPLGVQRWVQVHPLSKDLSPFLDTGRSFCLSFSFSPFLHRVYSFCAFPLLLHPKHLTCFIRLGF